MRYYWNDYENNEILATKDRTELFFALLSANPDCKLHSDGIETQSPIPVGKLPLFVAIADQTTIDALAPKPIERPPKEKRKVGRPSKPKILDIAKKQKYLEYCESAYNASDSLRYRAYLVSEWTRTKNQIDEITKNSTDTLDANR